MNDFTKEELEELLRGYQLHQHDNRYNWPLLDLCKKLQSLIDNYCQNKEIVCIGGWVQKCVKCGMKFGDETQ